MSTVFEAAPLDRTAATPLRKGESCTMVIFGASGDLTRRKLIPALYDLDCIGCMNPRVRGAGHWAHADEYGGVPPHGCTKPRRIPRRQGTSTNRTGPILRSGWFTSSATRIKPDFYPQLRSKLERDASGRGKRQSPLLCFHSGFGGASDYRRPGGGGAEPQREGLVAHRPGEALRTRSGTARALIKPPCCDVFDERDVYRIDHYLGKETVQNILVFRFANSLFEPMWNRNYIDYVEITAAETVGVENRAAFYEETGALRDMVANHLLQLLALTAMEPPVAFDADAVREQKVQVFRAIRPMTRGGGGAPHRARTVRAGRDRRPKCAGLPAGAGRGPEFADRNLCGHRVPRGQLAMGGRAVLCAHRQAAGAAA